MQKCLSQAATPTIRSWPTIASYGFCGLVPKPYTMQSLSDAVNSVINRSNRKASSDQRQDLPGTDKTV